MSGQVNILYNDGHRHSAVEVAGEFTHWKPVPLENHSGSKYSATFDGVQPGNNYMYKFLVDKQWKLFTNYPTVSDGSGNLNHLVIATNAVSGTANSSPITTELSTNGHNTFQEKYVPKKNYEQDPKLEGDMAGITQKANNLSSNELSPSTNFEHRSKFADVPMVTNVSAFGGATTGTFGKTSPDLDDVSRNYVLEPKSKELDASGHHAETFIEPAEVQEHDEVTISSGAFDCDKPHRRVQGTSDNDVNEFNILEKQPESVQVGLTPCVSSSIEDIPTNGQIPGSLPFEREFRNNNPNNAPLSEKYFNSTSVPISDANIESNATDLDTFSVPLELESSKLLASPPILKLDDFKVEDNVSPITINPEPINVQNFPDSKDISEANESYTTVKSSFNKSSAGIADHPSNIGKTLDRTPSPKIHEGAEVHSGKTVDDIAETMSPKDSARSHRSTIGGVPTLSSESKKLLGSPPNRENVLGLGSNAVNRNSTIIAAASMASTFAQQDVDKLSNLTHKPHSDTNPSPNHRKSNKSPKPLKTPNSNRRSFIFDYIPSWGGNSTSKSSDGGKREVFNPSSTEGIGGFAKYSLFDHQKSSSTKKKPKMRSKIRKLLDKLGID